MQRISFEERKSDDTGVIAASDDESQKAKLAGQGQVLSRKEKQVLRQQARSERLQTKAASGDSMKRPKMEAEAAPVSSAQVSVQSQFVVSEQ